MNLPDTTAARRSYEDILRAQTHLAKQEPTTPEERADWWRCCAELHSAYAANWRIRGWGAAADAYHRAARAYDSVGNTAAAAEARGHYESCLRLAART